YWAEITEARRLIDLPQALGLRDLHVWTDTTIAERFDWGREEGIWVLILRVYRLPQAVELPMLPEYGGCKSWIELQASIDTRGSVPVVADSDWNHYLGAITERLGTSAA
ncbi:MAG TPA: DUF1802 family protein, partial [Candidatus Limnocylindria bacterium]|nr:DUF1802 family protein [Candidatus Limnocylindria bacterium]